MTAIYKTVTSVTVVSGEHPLAAEELAQACGTTLEWVLQAAELGIVDKRTEATSPEAWQFQDTDLSRALEACRLQRDMDVELDVAALILDLQQEVRRLKAALAASQNT